ncbi:MAG: 16S rRNA (guanine(527)-N(7))-methyltransferase RsmG [Phycisphaeraceae bacterium]|nr:16S rRNA (guanine(527)-N(7))-methyltransferase RsmG [Phycisphaeraceae bacterium]
MPPSWVIEKAALLHADLGGDHWRKLAALLELIDQANAKMNLTAIRDHQQAWERHILDSLTLLDFLAPMASGQRIADVGSGAGLPGIPLAIARPDLTWLLIEATGKKARFLEETRAALELENVKVLAQRAEDAGRDPRFRQKLDAVVCRAVGPMRELLEYTLPLLTIGGVLLAMKGPKAKDELTESGDALQLLGADEVEVFDAWPEGSEWNTVVVRVVKGRATPRDYPRPAGTARRSPL